MSEDRKYLSLEQAIELLPEGESIHTYLDSSFAMLGADWDREKVIELLKKGKPEIGGPQCIRMGHGLVAHRKLPDGRVIPVFIETKKGALMVYECGEENDG